MTTAAAPAQFITLPFGLTSLSAARLTAVLAPNALLWAAIGTQYIGGFFPCEMCMWQRWAHIAAIVLALMAIAVRAKDGPSAAFTLLAAFAIAVSGGIGIFHAGVEYQWWDGITACTANVSGGTTDDVLNAIMNAPITRCDVPQWTLGGISLAGFNAIFSLAAAAKIFWLLGRWRRGL